MDVAEAAEILRTMYREAPKDETVVQIHLFGIKYARELQGLSLRDIVAQAGLSHTYATEINKARNLAKYVTVND